FGYAMLARRLGAGHPLVRLARRAERALGHRADGHLCVSAAMQAVLAAQWNVAARVLYDRPPRRFAPAPAAQRDATLQALCAQLDVPAVPRPVLIVSPSSWTADEDFDLLLDAAARIEARAAPGDAPWLMLLTGAGAWREHYERRIAARAAGRVHLRTRWLAPADYPAVLAAADLGLCLHRSTSGLDLPMKIADMLGAGLPVCALDYAPCLGEMLHAGETGVLFRTAEELADRLGLLFDGTPAGHALLARLRAGAAAAAAGERWDDAWRAHAAPLILP
ncbi:MAG: glycosyltransferase family protein, partial [Candidatus Binatia bacterium]